MPGGHGGGDVQRAPWVLRKAPGGTLKVVRRYSTGSLDGWFGFRPVAPVHCINETGPKRLTLKNEHPG